ncbi:MAG: hypothetical protein C0483_19055 [Pirellula sp.]|nr:hypothetical protein [Pirellula sp.]
MLVACGLPLARGARWRMMLRGRTPRTLHPPRRFLMQHSVFRLLRPALLLAALAVIGQPPVSAAEIRVATWNVHEGFTPAGIAERKEQLREFASAVRPDVLILQEVVTPAVATAVRDAMGLDGYYVACSNFNPSDEPDFTALEVAVLSRWPLTQVIEYDPTPDNDLADGDPDELPIAASLKLGLPAPADLLGTRGFLWVRIADVRLTVVGVHLKSSRGVDGEADRENARRREFVAAAVAESVAQDIRLFPDHTAVVGGDMNVGHSDPKNGRDLARDDLATTATTDGYDETHAILLELGGVRMTNLMRHISETTFPTFPSTPIDNMYVAGAAASRFAPATMSADTYGSDHRPVVSSVKLDFAPTSPTPAPGAYLVPTVRPRPATSTKRSGAPKSVAELGPPVAVALADVAANVGKHASVDFVVLSGNKLENGRMAFLNAKENFRDADNFTVVINTEGLKKFQAAGISDPSEHFRGKRIRATGVIADRSGARQIIVSDPALVELLP